MTPRPEPRHNYLARKVEDHSRDIPLAERTFRALKHCFDGGAAERAHAEDIKRRMRGEDWELGL